MMKKNKYINTVIIIGTTFVTIIFLLSVIRIYESILEDTKESHQKQQTEMAKTATTGIKTYLNHLEEDLEMFANYMQDKLVTDTNVNSSAKIFFDHYRDKNIESLFITDNNFNIIKTVGKLLPEPAKNNFFLIDDTILKTDSVIDFFYSNVKPFEPDNENLFFTILYPVSYNQKKLNNNKLTGYVGFLVNFDSLMQKFIAPLKLSDGDFAWVIDEKGRLIFHPEHDEMLLKSIKENNDECLDCHSSFKMQNNMLTGDASTSEYKIGDEPVKIMAYVPIQLKNKKWILAISTLLPVVTSNLRDKFYLFFGLGILILSVFLTFGGLLYWTNTKRIRAEESSRYLEKQQLLQEQLNQAAKFASIGELVDTVAHEVNTPLGIISAHADAIMLQNKIPDELSEDLSIIKNQTRRINTYTKSLLGFSKRLSFDPEPVSIKSIINECLYLIQYRLKSKKIKVFKNYTNNLPLIALDRGQIEHVFLNLFNNSIDAIDKTNGEIKISAEVDDSKIKSEDNKFMKIVITDNGSGISKENIDNIFRPFFTTKTEQRGTGLGLSITNAIINRHKGKIKVESEYGKYTRFTIYLPINNKVEAYE